MRSSSSTSEETQQEPAATRLAWDQDTGWNVGLPAFEGPFDVLLQLAIKQKVALNEISLADITDSYLQILMKMHELNLEITTDFLVIAATLIELKAARLIPGANDDDIDDELLQARDLLYARLLDYRMFRDAGRYVQQVLEEQSHQYPRSVPLDPALRALQPPPVIPLDIAGLGKLCWTLEHAQVSTLDVSHIRPHYMTIAQAATIVLDWLQNHGGQSISFATMLQDCRDRHDVISHFLAVLELYKRDRITISQPEGTAGELLIGPTDIANSPLDIQDY